MRRRRRWRRYALRALAVIIPVGFAAAIVGGFAYRDVRRVRSAVTQAHGIAVDAMSGASSASTTSQRDAIRTKLAAADDRLASAEADVRSSWSLRFARLVPVIGRQANGLLQLVVDSRTATVAGVSLIDTLNAAAHDLTFNQGSINLAAVRRVEDQVHTAASQLQSVVRPNAGLLGPLGSARRLLDDKAAEVAGRLASSGDALGVVRSLLGENEPRRYFVPLQNNAEMRDSGMVLSYAVVTFVNGHMAVERHGSIEELGLSAPVNVPLPRGTDLAWGDEQPTRLWQSVMAPADFVWSARVMKAMYAQAASADIDGVIALDVPALADAMRVTGPLTVASVGTTLTGDNLAAVLLDQLYRAASAHQSFRHQQVSDVATELLSRISNGGTDTLALARQLGDAAAGGHLRLWSSRDDEEHVIEATGLGGGPAIRRPDRTFHVAVENGTASKLDYWVTSDVSFDVTLTQFGTAVVKTTVTVINPAPLSGVSAYQVGPDGLTQKRAGEYIGRVAQWAPRNAVQPGALPESGLGLQTKFTTVEAGGHGQVEFVAVIPNAVRDGRLELRLVPQARLTPPTVRIALHAPGWRVTGGPPSRLSWARTVTATWTVGHG